jgi:hypothetical protein
LTQRFRFPPAFFSNSDFGRFSRIVIVSVIRLVCHSRFRESRDDDFTIEIHVGLLPLPGSADGHGIAARFY